MSNKIVSFEGIGEVSIQKRSGQKTIRLSVSGGNVKVSQPSWLPFSAGEAFLKSKLEWVKEHHKPQVMFKNNQIIGKNHTLTINYGDAQSNRTKNGCISVTFRYGQSELSKTAQNYIKKAVIKALRDEAESYLPSRTRQLAKLHSFKYKSVSIKQLKRRWGSCNSKNEITYNLHLMDLSYEQIDYVILHELCHTVVMNHSPKFWIQMESVYPGARKQAKIVRRFTL